MNNRIKFTITVFAITIILIGCASPESDGIMAAKKYIDAKNNSLQYCIKSYTNFINSFAGYNFQTRIEARQKVQEIDNNAAAQYNSDLINADRFFKTLSQKYITNYSRNETFQYAFSRYRDSNLQTDDALNSYNSTINNLILTIIPPKPDVDKFKNDLVGRRISEGADGYRGQGWYWEIKSVNQVDISSIQNEAMIGDDYTFNVQLILRGENSDYSAALKVIYVLRQNDDWKIDVIETLNMEIIQTHKYDNFITVGMWGMLGEHRYDFMNSADVPLLVGGVVLSEYYNTWNKFSIVVDANGKATVGDMFNNRIKDYKIHFIERP
ncbi:MAG: hypothetical protein FWD78_04815 [Treponema sp.]|nr:hypothetical protein [Treponema sp.]